MSSEQPPIVAPSDPAHRPVRSFVLREGRMTSGQKRALEANWAVYGLQPPPTGSRLDPTDSFARTAPLTVEIGFGNGDNLFNRASAEPERNFLGIEVHRPGVGRLLDHAVDAGLANLRVSTVDAVEVLRDWLPAGCVDELQILFPDPWPKKRHHKRRLIQPGFLDVAAGALASGGTLLLATDWADYAEQMRETVNAHDAFINLAADSGCVERPASRQITRFEARGVRLGHDVFDFAYRRR